jgi:hypothetical protein
VRKAARGTARLVRSTSNPFLLRQYLCAATTCAPRSFSRLAL